MVFHLLYGIVNLYLLISLVSFSQVDYSLLREGSLSCTFAVPNSDTFQVEVIREVEVVSAGDVGKQD